jgi:hypothetical protein
MNPAPSIVSCRVHRGSELHAFLTLGGVGGELAVDHQQAQGHEEFALGHDVIGGEARAVVVARQRAVGQAPGQAGDDGGAAQGLLQVIDPDLGRGFSRKRHWLDLGRFAEALADFRRGHALASGSEVKGKA